MQLDIAEYRNPAGNIPNFNHRIIGEHILAYARDHSLSVHDAFKKFVIPKFDKTGENPHCLSPRELISTACQCGPVDNHGYKEAVVVLYRAWDLKPHNAKMKLVECFVAAGLDPTTRDVQFAMKDAEFYLGLPRNTLYSES